MIITNQNDALKVILDQKILALYQDDKAEIGPRALGNRSFLFDPRNTHGKEIVNKGRYQAYKDEGAASISDSIEDDFLNTTISKEVGWSEEAGLVRPVLEYRSTSPTKYIVRVHRSGPPVPVRSAEFHGARCRGSRWKSAQPTPCDVRRGPPQTNRRR